ncbi:dihydroorotate oxidase B, electron transfer subunit [Desulfonatronum zhilinae]|nr:dihydroorotate oxidase B, electron transfer subunit [Desulfonatronum zhilinae]
MPDDTLMAADAASSPVCREFTVLELRRTGLKADLASPSKDGPDHSHWLLDLEPPADFPGEGGWTPGQFVMLRPVSWAFEPLWARPFSICMLERGVLRIFFQVVGRGTRAMSVLRRGDRVVVWGPLGRGFVVEPETPTLLLAGGIGLAPFIGYARRHPRPDTLRLFFGHRPEVGEYPLDLLPQGMAVEASRQTCAEELACFVGDLERRIAEYAGTDGLILACGPHPFLQAVQSLAVKHRARAQLSLENRMACGVGACLGCVTETTNQALPVKVCTQGPVFWAHELHLGVDLGGNQADLGGKV